jgi:hypothetical protein
MQVFKRWIIIFIATFSYLCYVFSLWQIGADANYVDSGPPFLILLHPALGPLWEVTRQKVTLYIMLLSMFVYQ